MMRDAPTPKGAEQTIVALADPRAPETAKTMAIGVGVATLAACAALVGAAIVAAGPVAAQATVGVWLDVVPLAVISVAWRRFGLKRTWFWLRAAIALSALWDVISCEPGFALAINACVFPLFCVAHIVDCRRLGETGAP